MYLRGVSNFETEREAKAALSAMERSGQYSADYRLLMRSLDFSHRFPYEIVVLRDVPLPGQVPWNSRS